MKTSQILIPVLLVGLFATGCRGNRGNHELLTRELRLLEDEIYHLEDELEESLTRLDSSRRENATMRRRLHNRVEDDRDARDGGGGNWPPSVELTPNGELPEAPPYEGPPDIQLPDSTLTPEFEAPEEQPMPDDGTSAERRAMNEPDDADWLVNEVTLSRLMTGGHNVNGQVGDEGVLVVVEPRNASGDVIDVPGDISIGVFDRSLIGQDQRIARWDFTAKEAADLFRPGPIGRGLHFELRWANELPIHEDLEVVARYIRYDGKKLFADKLIKVDLLDEVIANWKPAAEGTSHQAARPSQQQEPHPNEPGPHLAPPQSVALEPYEQYIEEKQAATPPPPTRVAQRRPAKRQPTATESPQAPGTKGRPQWTPYR